MQIALHPKLVDDLTKPFQTQEVVGVKVFVPTKPSPKVHQQI
jgi:hypothetical protein